MTWERQMSLYVDVDRPGGRPCLLEGTFSNDRTTPLHLMQGDRFDLRIYFRRRSDSGVTSTPVQLPAGDTVVFSGKPKKGFEEASPLFTAAGFAEQAEGDEYWYTATLDMTSTAINDALGTDPSIAVAIDIEVEDQAGASRVTFRVDATMHRQSYAGESGPASGLYPGSMVRQFVDDDDGQEYVAIFTKTGKEVMRWEA